MSARTSSLLQLCTKWVCTNFTKTNYDIAILPEDLKDKLLAYFLQTRTLTNNILLAFLLPTQRHLRLDEGGWLSLDCFSSVATHCAGLQSLSLANCYQLTPKIFADIVSSCKDLRAICIRGCTLLDDDSLHSISIHCKNLVYLDAFEVTKLTNQGVSHLSNSSGGCQLEFVRLGKCKKISNAALDSLSQLPNLKEINLMMCPLVTSNGLVPLANGPAGTSLHALDISHCGNILDQGLATIASITQLRTLQLTGMMRITPEGVASVVKQCAFLEVLSISRCKQLTNEAVISIFSHCKNLVSLDISFLDQITDEAFSNLPPMPSLISLVMFGVLRITDVAIKEVAVRSPNLQVWGLWKCVNITDEGVTSIGLHCHQMVLIQLSECSRITDKGIIQLAIGCPHLATVVLGGWATISDVGVKALSTHCKSIRTIDLGGLVSITNQSLRYLGESCPNLFSVSLYDCKSVTAEGIHSLVGVAPALQRLDVGGRSGVTPQQLAHITSRYSYLEVVAN